MYGFTVLGKLYPVLGVLALTGILCLQGDDSGCAKPPVDIKTKVPFL